MEIMETEKSLTGTACRWNCQGKIWASDSVANSTGSGAVCLDLDTSSVMDQLGDCGQLLASEPL